MTKRTRTEGDSIGRLRHSHAMRRHTRSQNGGKGQRQGLAASAHNLRTSTRVLQAEGRRGKTQG